jgi:hypothetical protein
MTAPSTVSDGHAEAFEQAWAEFTTTCSGTIAPEATYQAWLAHFMIQRVGLMHVVREVDFGARHLGDTTGRFRGSNLMVDLLVLREPVVDLPRRAALAQQDLPDGHPNPRSGLGRLKDFTVITELKVSATQRTDWTRLWRLSRDRDGRALKKLPVRRNRTGCSGLVWVGEPIPDR